MARAKGVKSAITKTAKSVVVVQAKSKSAPLKPVPSKAPLFPKDPQRGVRYWLIKSEPFSRIDPKTGKDAKFSFESLSKETEEPWDGVRNFEAKNNLLSMRPLDYCLFYHSNCPDPGIVGLAQVVNEAHPDLLQFDPKSNYYDPKATEESPRWWCPDVKFFGLFHKKIRLSYLKNSDEFQDMLLVKRGRLSVIPVSCDHFNRIIELQKLQKGESEISETFEEFDCDTSQMNYIPDVL